LHEEDTTLSDTSIVEALIDTWNRMDWDAIDDLMAEGIFYHNVPMEPFEGRAAAGASVRGIGCVSGHWHLLSIAENGDKVLTERADSFELANGRKLSVPIMGTFELEDGRMQAWPDYFDAATVAGQMA
jgi:limonene-1,2-epoxide hydrolase